MRVGLPVCAMSLGWQTFERMLLQPSSMGN